MNFTVNAPNKDNIYEAITNNVVLKYKVLDRDDEAFSVQFISMNKIDNAPEEQQLLLMDKEETSCREGKENYEKCPDTNYPCFEDDEGTCKNKQGETLQTVLQRQLDAAQALSGPSRAEQDDTPNRGGRKRKKTKKRKHKRKKKTRRRKK